MWVSFGVYARVLYIGPGAREEEGGEPASSAILSGYFLFVWSSQC